MSIAALFSSSPTDATPFGPIVRPDLDGHLVAAAALGDTDRVKILLDERANIDARSDPMTALRAPATGLAGKIQQDVKANNIATPSNKRGRTALQAAAEGGHEAVVKLLLDRGADFNAAPLGTRGRTALQAAAESGHGSIVGMLLEAGANVDAVPSDRAGRTALQAAAEAGHVSVVEMLLGADADVNAVPASYDGRTALQAAAEKGHGSVVKLLMDAGGDANAEPSGYYGRTALRAAAEGGHESVVKQLLHRGADPNAAPLGARGRTALQAAAEGGHVEIVEMLLQGGANVNAAPASYYGRTALQAAAEGGHRSVVEMLLEARANVNAAPSGSHGRTALQVAADGGFGEVVEILLKAGANVNARGSKGTALQAAAGGGHGTVVQMLLDGGATIGEGVHSACIGGYEPIARLLHQRAETALVRDSLGRSPLHLACLHSRHEVAKWLLSSVSKVDINMQDYEKQTPLHLATRKGNLKLFDFLLEKRPDMEVLDSEDRRPLHIALEASFAQAATKLLEKGASARGFTVDNWRTLLPSRDSFLMTEEDTGSKSIKTVDGADELGTLDSARARQLVSVSTRYLYSTLNSETDVGPFLFPPVDPASPAELKWMWTKIGLGQLWDGPVWKNGIPFTSNIVTLAPREALISCSVVFSLSVDALGPTKSGMRAEIMAGVENRDGGAVKPFRMKGETSRISWIMVARSDDNTNKEGSDSKSPADQKPLVNLRTVEYRGTLNIGWIPDHGVEFFTLFIADLHEKWRKNLEDARIHQATNYGKLLGGRGENRLLIGTLLTDAQQWGQLHVLLAKHVASARGLVADYGEKSLLYDEMKCWEQGHGSEGIAKKALETLSRTIGDLESGCTEEISGLEKKTKEMIELEFSLVSIHEAQRSTSMAASMKRLSWITFIFLPLMFVASLFGMNLDVLADNPPWPWYVIIGGPILALVLIVWLVFKHSPVERWSEEIFRSALAGVGALFRKLRARMARLKKGGDEESGGVKPGGKID